MGASPTGVSERLCSTHLKAVPSSLTRKWGQFSIKHRAASSPVTVQLFQPSLYVHRTSSHDCKMSSELPVFTQQGARGGEPQAMWVGTTHV